MPPLSTISHVAVIVECVVTVSAIVASLVWFLLPGRAIRRKTGRF